MLTFKSTKFRSIPTCLTQNNQSHKKSASTTCRCFHQQHTLIKIHLNRTYYIFRPYYCKHLVQKHFYVKAMAVTWNMKYTLAIGSEVTLLYKSKVALIWKNNSLGNLFPINENTEITWKVDILQCTLTFMLCALEKDTSLQYNNKHTHNLAIKNLEFYFSKIINQNNLITICW